MSPIRVPSNREIDRAAAELASQERYNPGWCKPGDGNKLGQHTALYRQRARMILEAAHGTHEPRPH